MIYFYSQRYNKVKSEIVWENIDFFSIKGENRNTLSNCANVLSLVVNNCPNIHFRPDLQIGAEVEWLFQRLIKKRSNKKR